jgi:DUF218 domain
MNDDLNVLNDRIRSDRPRKSDAIVWLQGEKYDRGPKTAELYRSGWARKIIISGNDKLTSPRQRPNEEYVSLAEMKQWLLKEGAKEKDIIIEDRSFNTRDQALNVLSIGKKEKWKRIIIVGSFPHYQARCFLTFLKAAEEVGWDGEIVNQFVTVGDDEMPAGRGQTARDIALLEDEKIRAYQAKGHLVDIRTGIDYLKARNRAENKIQTNDKREK